MTKNYSAQLVSENSENIYRVNGYKNNVKRWYYIFVHRSKLTSFKDALATGNVDVSEYGDILAWGEGENPSQSLVQELEEKYKIKIIA